MTGLIAVIRIIVHMNIAGGVGIQHYKMGSTARDCLMALQGGLWRGIRMSIPR